MHTIIRSLKSRQFDSAVASKDTHRRPHYDCQEQPDALILSIYVPGVDPAGIEIEVQGPDLIVTAPKSHLVRTHWRAAHLENVQRDYKLRLRLGFSLDYDGMLAALDEGMLTVTIPKKEAVAVA
jgi:HSP20 family molecular chaperone IbpA